MSPEVLNIVTTVALVLLGAGLWYEGTVRDARLAKVGAVLCFLLALGGLYRAFVDYGVIDVDP